MFHGSFKKFILMPEKENPLTRRVPLAWSISFLSPAAVALLPIFGFAVIAREKTEAYEWAQHRLIGAGFAASFVAAFVFGRWSRGWATAIFALLALVAVVAMVQQGLTAPHLLFAVVGAVVATAIAVPAWVTVRSPRSP